MNIFKRLINKMTGERSIKDHPAYKQILLNADVKDMENSKQSFLDCTEFEANDYYESLKEFVDNPIKRAKTSPTFHSLKP